MKKKSKIVWAVDPFVSEPRVQAHSLAMLQALARRLNSIIYPVHILSDGLLGLSLPPAVLEKTYKDIALRRLEALVCNRGVSGMHKPEVVVCAPSSRSQAAEALDRFAQGKGADFIFISSHGRSGIKRAMLGSFAETLVLHAQTPVMISGPHDTAPPRLERIIFPTDFSPASRQAFGAAIGIAGRLRASLTVLHAVPDPAQVYVSAGATLLGAGFIPIRSMMKENVTRQRKNARLWVERARKKGVKAQAVIDVDTQSAAFSTLKTANKNAAGLIVMCSQSGGFSAAVLGSVGREVARTAQCPVLFLRHSD